jgi:uncharacterized protein (TIGR02246 family)
MSRLSSTAALALLVVLAAPACNDEPLSPGAGGSSNPESDARSIPASASGGVKDREAIQTIVNTFDQAWTAGDAVVYAAQYAGAEWVGPDGLVLTDPAAITAVYTAVLTFVFPGTTRQSTIRNLTFLTGTIAVLDIDARVTGFGPLPPGVVPWQPGTLRALEKNILVKRAGEWEIVKHQQTIVAAGIP